MFKQTARFVSLALLMFAASATPLTAKASSSQFDCPCPYPPQPPCSSYPLPCQLGVHK
jgi:hypothetical protein